MARIEICRNCIPLALRTEVARDENRTGPGTRYETILPYQSVSGVRIISKSARRRRGCIRFCPYSRSYVVRIQSDATAEARARIDCSAKTNFPCDVAVRTRICIFHYGCTTAGERLSRNRIGGRPSWRESAEMTLEYSYCRRKMTDKSRRTRAVRNNRYRC